MTNKIEEITKKIYNDGVVKAKEDAQKIEADAKQKAEEIIAAARNESEKILAQAKTKAEETAAKTNAELQLAARKFTAQLKQQITQLITTKQIHEPVKHALNDTEFVQQLILNLLQNWTTSENSLQLTLPEKEKAAFADFCEKRAKESMQDELHCRFDAAMDAGFKIGPADKSFVISFTDQDFENYFKRYLKEQTQKLLFEPESQE